MNEIITQCWFISSPNLQNRSIYFSFLNSVWTKANFHGEWDKMVPGIFLLKQKVMTILEEEETEAIILSQSKEIYNWATFYFS